MTLFQTGVQRVNGAVRRFEEAIRELEAAAEVCDEAVVNYSRQITEFKAKQLENAQACSKAMKIAANIRKLLEG